MKKSLLIIIFLLISASPVWAADYYAGPPSCAPGSDCIAGSGNTCTAANPGTTRGCLLKLAAGDTLYLYDGHYTGTSYMVYLYFAGGEGGPMANGTRGNPITIKAKNDGEVDIDGQGARRPVFLQNNDWNVIEGINAHSSNTSVVGLTNSDHNVFKRVIAWDASPTANYHVFDSGQGSNNTTYEDCAGWGTGRKIFAQYMNGSDDGTPAQICRRCFAMWTYSTREDPKFAYTTGYNTNGDVLFENVIGTWDELDGANQYQDQGPLGTDDNVGTVSILGSIFYKLQSQNGASHYLMSLKYECANAYVLENVLAYTDSTDTSCVYPSECQGNTRIQTLECGGSRVSGSYLTIIGGGETWADDPNPPKDIAGSILSVLNNSGTLNYNIVENSHAYGVNNGNAFDYMAFYDNDGGNWESNAPAHYTTTDPDIVGKCGNLIQYDCADPNRPQVNNHPVGAKIQYRYVDGSLTGQALWPWPMNDRIKEALLDSGYDTKGLDGRGNTDLTDVIFKLSGGTNPFIGETRPQAPSGLRIVP